MPDEKIKVRITETAQHQMWTNTHRE